MSLAARAALAVLAVLAPAGGASAQESGPDTSTETSAEAGFAAALRLVSEDRFAAALEAAALEPDPLARAQAHVHVRHHGGDLRGALSAALAGLEAAPSDPWLLEQGAFVAVSLNEGALAMTLAERLVLGLEALHPAGTEPGPRAALERAHGLREEARASHSRALERRASLRRARGVAFALLALCLALAAFLARTPARNPDATP